MDRCRLHYVPRFVRRLTIGTASGRDADVSPATAAHEAAWLEAHRRYVMVEFAARRDRDAALQAASADFARHRLSPREPYQGEDWARRVYREARTAAQEAYEAAVAPALEACRKISPGFE